MDTPAITPEILASSSNSSSTGVPSPNDSAAPQAQSQPQSQPLPRFLPQQTQLPPQPAAQVTPTMDSNFFAKSLRPLSPPESPFAFDAAFSAKATLRPTPTAPASPHFELPALVRPTTKPPTPKSSAKTKRERGWAKAVQKSTGVEGAENPYFPSIAEQERAERWARDEARFNLPQASPPVDTRGGAGGADPFSHANSSSSPSPSSSSGGFVLDLSFVRRRRALGLCASGGAHVPASPESMDEGRTGKGEGEGAYRRGMVEHLAERMKRRNVRPEPWGRDESRFEW